jgi:hypothetical protein
MNGTDLSTYLLIDNGLLQVTDASYTETDPENRPTWLAPIYMDGALAVSPFLVDVEAAYDRGELDKAVFYLNALSPALHVSLIETGLRLDQLARHLQRFIFIIDPTGRQFTLRFADCAVLLALSSVLTEAQWATIWQPINRWGVHERSGGIHQLVRTELIANEATPLHLDRAQMEALDEASEPDHYIAKVLNMRHGAELPGTAAEQHAWALAARKAWQASKNLDQLFLLFLTEAALKSHGKVMHRNELYDYLAMGELGEFRKKLRELTDSM